ncbi:MAG: hypothetical protein ETSY1_30250 [Candidatus Entotheonella factor]|uniref:Uncharacterized protein n=1 Tax=Entotheonella factor TaxID=1429438 RepID=W4LC11_ENTF1|nr:MAG: hypothetical protein ETSY1_30250 [Candidatus Entotheonella factor]
METSHIELTPEQKDVLASLAQETGETASSLIDKVLDELQERLRATRMHEREAAEPSPAANVQRTASEVKEEVNKNAPSVLDIFRETWKAIPEEELAAMPEDGAEQVDHYIYGTPKRR